jgi:hypothetical protein
MTRYVVGPDVAIRLADAFMTLDGRLANAVKDLVTVASLEALS